MPQGGKRCCTWKMLSTALIALTSTVSAAVDVTKCTSFLTFKVFSVHIIRSVVTLKPSHVNALVSIGSSLDPNTLSIDQKLDDEGWQFSTWGIRTGDTYNQMTNLNRNGSNGFAPIPNATDLSNSNKETVPNPSSKSRGSTLFIGIVVLLQSLFVTNYFYVKSLRWKRDNESETQNLVSSEQMEKATDAINDTWLFFVDPKKLDKKRRKEKAVWLRQRRLLWLSIVFQGLFLNQVRKEPLDEKRFIEWKPIGKKKGLITTSILLILSSFLLSPSFLGSDSKDMLVPDLCLKEESDPLMLKMNDDLDLEMNLNAAREQANFYANLAQALKNDTSLYGLGEYRCPDVPDNNSNRIISGDKTVWENNRDSFPQSQYGEFFPGYCTAARIKALENARTATCEKEICIKGVVGFFTRIFAPSQRCRRITIGCPKHTADQESQTENYQIAQYQRAQAMQEAIEVFAESAENKFDEVTSNAGETLAKILFRIDVASSIYVLYKGVSLFLPAPLEMFRPAFGTMIKMHLFGASSATFCLSVLATWWGIEYFSQLHAQLQTYINADYLKAPCFTDKDFLQERTVLLYDKCEEIVNLSNSIALDNVTIHHIAAEALAFQKHCKCRFPHVHTKVIDVPYTVAEVGLEEIKICQGSCVEDNIPEVPGWIININGQNLQDLVDEYGVIPAQSFEFAIPLPPSTLAFLGNNTVCFDTTYSRQKYFTPPKTNVSILDVWLKTGILAMLSLRLFIAILGFWLLRLADPFSSCDGRYINPPKKYVMVESEESLTEMKDNTLLALHSIALKQVIIYGCITNLALINIIIVVAVNNDREKTKDALYLGTTLSIAFAVPIVAACFFNRDLGNKVKFWKKRDDCSSVFERLFYPSDNGRNISLVLPVDSGSTGWFRSVKKTKRKRPTSKKNDKEKSTFLPLFQMKSRTPKGAKSRRTSKYIDPKKIEKNDSESLLQLWGKWSKPSAQEEKNSLMTTNTNDVTHPDKRKNDEKQNPATIATTFSPQNKSPPEKQEKKNLDSNQNEESYSIFPTCGLDSIW